MSRKARRVATRQAELAARGHRRSRTEVVKPWVDDVRVVANGGEDEAPVMPSPQPRIRSQVASRTVVEPVQRATVYQYVGAEFRRIVVLACIAFAALATLAVALR